MEKEAFKEAARRIREEVKDDVEIIVIEDSGPPREYPNFGALGKSAEVFCKEMVRGGYLRTHLARVDSEGTGDSISNNHLFPDQL